MTMYPSGTLIANRYEVVQGPLENPSLAGGMGIVYLCADHAEQGRPVALKTFKPEYLPDRAARDRFLREGNTWVNLGRHPHIVQAHSVERIGDGREVYLVLELVAKEEGRADASLRSWLLPGKALPVEQALLFALQIVRGMLHATASIPGFVHRDLKPENVLVGSDQLSTLAVNRVRVTDFGLVKIVTEKGKALSLGNEAEKTDLRRAQFTRGAGTPLYMAPEQWKGEKVVAQTDIYAVGCILYEMLAGQRPVEGDSLAALEQAHCEGTLRPLPASLPEAVSEVVAHCLARRPEERHSGWAELEEVLVAAYTRTAGHAAPGPELPEALDRAERVAVGWSYSAIGASYLDIGKAEMALAHCGRAVEAGRAEGDCTLVGAGLNILGEAYRRLGDSRKAIEYFEDALANFRQSRNKVAESGTLTNLGLAYGSFGSVGKAIECHEQALALGNEIGDKHSVGLALGNLGVIYAEIGDNRRAFDCYEAALAIARETGDLKAEGDRLSNLGVVYKNLGDLARSVDYHQQALQIARQTGDRNAEGARLCNLGIAYHLMGDLHRALRYHEEALVIRREVGDRRGEARDLGNLGIAYTALGDLQQAESNYRASLAITEALGDTLVSANQYMNLAMLLTSQGRFNEALPVAQLCADIWVQAGHPNALKAVDLAARLRTVLADHPQITQTENANAQAYMNRGLNHARQQNYDEAITDFTCAIRLDTTYTLAYYNRGLSYAQTQRYDEALADFTQAIQLDPAYAKAYLNIGVLYFTRGALEEALPYFEKAAQLGLPKGSQYAAIIRGRLGGRCP